MNPTQLLSAILHKTAMDWGALGKAVGRPLVSPPMLVGVPVAGATYLGARAAGEDPVAAGVDAATLGIILGTSASGGSVRNYRGGSFGEALRDLKNPAGSNVWRLDPQSGNHILEFKDPALGITRSISAHDPVAARRALKPLASQFTTDAILNTVKQKAGLTLLGAGARAASDVAGIAGNVRAATGNVKDITAEGSKAMIGEGDKPGLVQNVTEQTNKIFANTADLSNSAQALGKAYAPKSKLDAKGNAILDAKGNPVMEPTVLDNVSSSVQKGGVAAERIANFLTDPKTYALAAGGIATAALGYVLYKHFTDKPDRAKRSRGPSDGAPRRPRHAPAEHTHAVPGGPVVPLVAQE